MNLNSSLPPEKAFREALLILTYRKTLSVMREKCILSQCLSERFPVKCEGKADVVSFVEMP
jgi:hypothetical protein